MRCYYSLCIYHSDGFCIVDEITINELSMCDTCIIVNIPENYLNKKRKEVIERLESQYKE